MSIFGLKIINGTLLNEAVAVSKDYNNDMIMEDFNYEYSDLLNKVLNYSEDDPATIISELVEFNKRLFMLNTTFNKRGMLLINLSNKNDLGKFYKNIVTDIPAFRDAVRNNPFTTKENSFWVSGWDSENIAVKLIALMSDFDGDQKLFTVNDIINTGVYVGDSLKRVSEYSTIVDYMIDYLKITNADDTDSIVDYEWIKNRVSDAVEMRSNDRPICITSDGCSENSDKLAEMLFTAMNDINRKMIDMYADGEDNSDDAIRSAVNSLVNCIFISILTNKCKLLRTNRDYIRSTTLFNYLSEMFNK